MSKLLGDFLQEQQEPFSLQVRGIKKKQLAVPPNCSAFLKAVFRLQFGRNALNLKGKKRSSLFNSSSDTETANAREGKVGAERKKKQRGDGRKQVSTVSLLLDQTESLHFTKKGEPSKSLISECKLKKQRLKEFVGPNSCEEYMINGISKVLHLLHSDLLASEDEWNADFELQKMEIWNGVENAIFEDVINEIVTF